MGAFLDAINHDWTDSGAARQGGFGDHPDLQEQAGLYDIPHDGEERPGLMMPVSPPSFADRLAIFGDQDAPKIEDRRGEKVPPRWGPEPFPLPATVWLNEIQREMGTNWTPPGERIGKIPARLSPGGQLPEDVGIHDILKK
jgi:hypothetical protein